MVLRTIRLRTTLLLGGSATARRDRVPYGLAGGRAGTPSRNVLNPGTEERELPAKCTLTVRSGDVYRHELAGAAARASMHSVDVELARDGMATVGHTPQDDKLAHPYAETRQGGNNTAVRHQYQRRSTTVSSDSFPDLGKLALTAFRVVERALQGIPWLRLPEG